MKIRVALGAVGLTIGVLVAPVAALAANYDLGTDIGSVNTSGSPWSITYSGGALVHYEKSQVTDNNHLYDAIPDPGGIIGPSVGGNLSLNDHTPFVFKSALNGSQTDEVSAGVRLKDTDFLANDLIIHSPNDGTMTIAWKAPTAGTITQLLVSTWYAHSTVDRSNTAGLTVENSGATITPPVWTVTNASNRNAQNTYSNAGPIQVDAGDLISLTFAKTSGQTYGSLDGVRMSLAFAAAPIPAALPLFVSALAGLGWAARRKRKQAA